MHLLFYFSFIYQIEYFMIKTVSDPQIWFNFCVKIVNFPKSNKGDGFIYLLQHSHTFHGFYYIACHKLAAIKFIGKNNGAGGSKYITEKKKTQFIDC